MQEYIARPRKLGADDYVNGETFNSIIQQLQHNIDLLYRSQASSTQNWNISELVWGNMMDYDQIGQKRYTNGGKLDSLEKILPFSATSGEIDYEEVTLLNNDSWLRWSVPGGISSNISLVRNIAIPEALRHQNILVAVKFMPYVGNIAQLNERYEIYVNGIYSGTGETGTVTINGVVEAKTIYGVYSLTGEETNLEIKLVRSPTNGNTPLNYVVRVSNMFVGLHTLGNTSFSMNYPISGSLFNGAGADINAFYDFLNNAVRPIPAFLINNEFLDGGSSLTVNITSQAAATQSTYYIGITGTGNQLGINDENVMDAQDFFLLETFTATPVTVYLQNTDQTYPAMTFDKGNYEVYLNNAFTEIGIESLTVADNSSVTFVVEPNASSTKLTIDEIAVTDHSRLELRTDGSSNKLKIINDDGISVGEQSFVDISVGTYAAKISGAGNLHVYNGGKLHLTLNEASYTNVDGEYGFGLSTGSVYLDQYAYFDVSSENSIMQWHVGRGQRDAAITVNNHSHLVSAGFDTMSTSSISGAFNGKLHSSIEIFNDIQSDGGATAYTDVKMELFSTFGSPISGGTFNEDLLESFVYEIE